jgi:hypothetical protein
VIWRHCEKLDKAVCSCQECQGCEWYEAEGELPVSEKTYRCEDVREPMPAAEMAEYLQYAPPGPWPDGWSAWPNVRQAHLILLEQFIQTIPAYPDQYSGRGIVSCVSAKPGWSSGKELANGYLPGAWVMVKELRRLGCTLPITFCHLGPLEWDPILTRLMEPLGVSVIDLREWERQNPMRILAGWESKVAAILAAPYKEVLFLDADNVPVRDPSFLFESPQFKHAGAIFWPDLPPYDRDEWLPKAVWDSVGLPYSSEPDFESGQLMVDKRRCWYELQVTRWINEHSDYYYRLVFGDKSTFRLGWAKLNAPYALTKHQAGWNGGSIIQHDFAGTPLFEHGAQNKPTLGGYPKPECLRHRAECESHLADLRERWSGRLWDNPHPSQMERELRDSLIGQRFVYRRIGLGEREIRLLEDDRIGRGLARCEVSWSIVGDRLVISDLDGKPTLFAQRTPDGVWRGEWIEFERCAVELEPL